LGQKHEAHASTSALTLSEEMARRAYRNLDFFRQRIAMRQQEITNHPEILRRLGIISMNKTRFVVRPPRLSPPAIERAQVEDSVGRRLHAAGAARLRG